MQKEQLNRILTHGWAFDTETHRIQPGLLSPPLVCGSFAWRMSDGFFDSILHDRENTLEVFRSILKDKVLIGANIAYDILVCAVEFARKGVDVLPEIFKAYQEERVYDVQIAEQLHAIAGGHLGKDPRSHMPLKGRYSLETCVDLVLNRTNAKVNDYWRLRYALLEEIPIEEWPEDARTYPIDDAVNTLEVCLAQIDGRNQNLHDLSAQCYAAWCLHLAAAYGLRTDPIATEELSSAVEQDINAGLSQFVDMGFIRANGTEDGGIVRTAVAIAYGVDKDSKCEVCKGFKKLPGKNPRMGVNCSKCNGTGLDITTALVPKTDPSTTYPHGQIKISRDTLSESGNDILAEYSAWQENDKLPSTYIPWLREGYEVPITLKPNVILDTGRVSYYGPVQLLPRTISNRLKATLKARGSKVQGVRDCIIPRIGNLFYSVDFVAGELTTFAEACVQRVGFSTMGKALNSGMDVHSQLAAQLMNETYETFIEELKVKKNPKAKAYRQTAKVGNFGFPGGMGEARLVISQRAQGPDTETPDGPTDLGNGKRGYKGMRFCILIGGAKRCGEVKVTEWNNHPCPPTCKACLEQARILKATWFATWKEAKLYLNWHAENAENVGEIEQLYSKRIRGGASSYASSYNPDRESKQDFCSEANGDFQGLLADIAKRAQCRVSYGQYVDKNSVLYGSRSILFAHDELFGEARTDVAADVAECVKQIMVQEFKKGCPNHEAACKAEASLMHRWYKNAEPIFDNLGKLIPWEPR